MLAALLDTHSEVATIVNECQLEEEPLSRTALRDAQAALGSVETEGEGIRHYGDADAEYESLIASAGLIDRSDRGKLRIEGGDRARFLHGMLTNTVETLGPGEGNHTALTDPQGRTQADMHLYSRGDVFFVETEPGLQADVFTFLDQFLIADDVTIEDVTEAWCIMGVQGPQSPGVLSDLGTDLPEDVYDSVDVPGGGWVVKRIYAADVGYDLWIPADKAVDAWTGLVEKGARPAGLEAAERRRIERGHPRYGVDVDTRVVPLEAGLEDTVSFTKGCFIGQETLAKMHNLGKPRRYLVGLAIGRDNPPESGDQILDGEKVVGDVKSWVESPRMGGMIALASVRRGSETPGTTLRLQNGDEATVTALPFIP